MRTILSAVVTIALTVTILALIVGISLAVGWLLTIFLPFSLFEGTLLAMIAGIATGTIWRRIMDSPSISRPEEEAIYSEPDGIPQSRFWESGADRTWGKLFRYVLANSIYKDLLYSPRWEGEVEGEQLQETSILLADAAVEVLKTKSPRAKRLRVSRAMLKRKMVQMEQLPYDDDVLDVAVAAMNLELAHHHEELVEVITGRLWDEVVEVPY